MNDHAALPDFAAGLLAGYRPPDGVADELLRRNGTIRPVWDPLLRYLGGQTPEQRAQALQRGDQYLRDAGVYFRHHSGESSTERDWPLSHIPVMIDGTEWQRLSRGIVQRAELLERVMADLYGPGDLVKNGLLPAELVARNPEWLRPVVGMRPRSGNFLHFLAFEIGRSPDGSWFVLGDRTQAPSGSGFALENRMATSRAFHELFPNANVERLASFFRSFRDRLSALRGDDGGRVAILTPGPHTDTYFEHAYMARYLGIMLLECEDLKVVDGRLMVRTVSGLEPLSVIWRRLDARFADPLELDEGTALGTPGMVSALRAGGVSMLNCLGSGVLEARALMAFLPRISRHLLGEPLELPNIATWWCGQSKERAYVRDNFEKMMIGPALSTQLPFEMDATTVLGGRFRGAAHAPVADWIEAEGDTLVGQEAVSLSTTPALIDGVLQPRPMVVRVFAARTENGWTVMPGGYARIGKTEDPTALAMQDGGSVADVWIVSDAPVAADSLTGQASGPFMRQMPGRLPARSADNLFWLGRFVERADFTVRLLRAYHLRLEEGGQTVSPVTRAVETYLKGLGLDLSRAIPEGLLELFDLAKTAAGKVRDRFSPDGWNAINDLALTARALAVSAGPGDDAARAMGVLLRKLAGFAGLVHDNMFRFTGWRFLTIGRALERGYQMSGLLAVFADLGAPPGGFEVAIEVGDSAMTHRRRYSVETNRNTTIDLLVLDRENPRSVLFQIDALHEEQRRLPQRGSTSQMTPVARKILSLQTRIAVATPEEMSSAALNNVMSELAMISDSLTAQYMS
ncbi:Uncharacterized conserved protein, circularly permuted ATPgrasp superfamily [Poseidonocella pacifica]|uniref:Uncharacterized conserved protein, circularly permuted ATPgrasp superfamily n=1 Tax=Poseidonocella pacifica TaxID=871651 RepID=A0A1I0VAU5_9RHOB|nr:circularly permuted type 2 ATP-grasp protein [Poseidonocella pacifica]SFA73177.1 Uncharacterized conserved protein, circularly permuted ATPgrasp superfamily [Poseidonocella pacifica]